MVEKTKTGKSVILMNKYILICLALLCFTGCFGEKRPADFPDIYPCEIKLVQENQPLTGASIVLSSGQQDLDRWAVSGITDENGLAQIRTNGKYVGAPAGKFTVCVSKDEITEGEEKIIGGEKVKVNQKKFLLVEKIYSDPAASPLKIEIEKKKNHFDLEAGKKIRLSIPMIQ